MTRSLDERFPHTSECPLVRVKHGIAACDCDQRARIASHIERLEGALRTVGDSPFWSERNYDCMHCNGGMAKSHDKDCPVPGIEALMAELGENP